MLWRILAASVLLLVLQLLAADTFDRLGAAGRWIRLVCYLTDYFIIGYDILRKALKGIRNGQIFDENFIVIFRNGSIWRFMKIEIIWKPLPLCFSTR